MLIKPDFTAGSNGT